MKIKSVLIAIVILGVCAGAAFADSGDGRTFIVDTGAPPDQLPGWSLYGSSRFTGLYQWLAGKVTFSESNTINGAEGWLGIWRPGNLTLAIYGDGGTIPNTANQFFAGNFNVPGVDNDPASGWYGASGMNLTLPAGSYWFAFEVREGDQYSGYMPGNNPNNPIPRPLDYYASSNELMPYWHAAGQGAFGLRVYTNTAPEPVSMVLFGLGGLTMAVIKRRRSKA